MLTPQEVSQHAFAKANFGGYNMAMVDEFLDQLTEDYTALYKENALLKNKMKVLVDKVEEYRATEDGMRKALLAAQRTAEEIVAEAEGKKAEMLRATEEEVQAKTENLRREMENEQTRLNAAKSATASYVAKLKDLYEHEMEYLNGLSELTAPAPSRTDKAAEEINSSMQKIIEKEAAEEEEAEEPTLERELTPEEKAKADGKLYAEILEIDLSHRGKREAPPAPEAEPERDERQAQRSYEEEKKEEPTQRIDFGHLRFGKDYDLD